jgi:Fe-S cluster biogenesis protein NfuA
LAQKQNKITTVKVAKRLAKKTATSENVNEILGKVRPYIQMHGGDVALVSVKDGIVTLSISGACSHCLLADLTYNTLIAGLLRDEFDGIKDIVIEK